MLAKKPNEAGAPINVPYTAIEIIDIPTPLSIPLIFPTRLYAIGIIEDVPRPKKENAIMASNDDGLKILNLSK